AWLAVRLSWVWICFMLEETVFSNERPVAWIVFLKSGGTRFCTSRSASRPALTAWLMNVPLEAELLEDELLDEDGFLVDDARFLLAMPCPPYERCTTFMSVGNLGWRPA